MKKVLCKNCICWKPKGDGSGFCQRHAPRPTVVKGEEGVKCVLVIPSTMTYDGCFEGAEA